EKKSINAALLPSRVDRRAIARGVLSAVVDCQKDINRIISNDLMPLSAAKRRTLSTCSGLVMNDSARARSVIAGPAEMTKGSIASVSCGRGAVRFGACVNSNVARITLLLWM